MSPQTMPSETESRANRAEDAIFCVLVRKMRGCGTTSGCSGASSAIPCATRRAPTCSTWSSASARPRSGSTATRTGRPGASSKPILDSMSISETVRIVRAFSYFSHLANIAEDQNNIRQMRGRERQRCAAGRHAGPDPVACAPGRVQPGRSAPLLQGRALVSPVLTAHPTEVRRKSTMDREMEIAALLDRRERVQLTPEEIEAADEQLRREVLTLWQTNLLRRTKLTVLDEVANGLSFYDYTFLHEVPRLHCVLEDRLNEEESGEAGRARLLPEDGKLDRRRPRRQSVRHRRRDARHAAAAVEPRPALLSGGAACARRGTVARGPSRRRFRGVARARRALARSFAAPQRRAVSPRGLRHLCAADRDRAEAGGRDHAAGRSARPRLTPASASSRPISTCSTAR